VAQKTFLIQYLLFIIRAPTGESVGSIFVKNFEPTDLPVGITKKDCLAF
jgi:hypothetical protein